MKRKNQYILPIALLLIIIMLFAYPVVGLVMLLIFLLWAIIRSLVKKNDHCAMCHQKLTIMNIGLGGRLKEGGQLCTSCCRHLSSAVSINTESYTLEELIEADKKAKTEQELLKKEDYDRKNAIRNANMHAVVDPVLGKEEIFEYALYGRYNGSKGYLALTSNRLLFVYQTPIEKVQTANLFATIKNANASTCDELPISCITDIKVSKMLFSENINIYLSNFIMVFESKESFLQTQTMVNKINERRGMKPENEAISYNDKGISITGTITRTNCDGEEDVFEKIAKLKKLLDSGAITEEEFLEKKKKLMDRI